MSRIALLPRSAAGRYAGLLTLLIVFSELQFRRRDPTLALEGVVDAQVIAQLGVWGLAGAWVAWRALGDARPFVRRLPEGVGPAMRAVLVLALLTIAWSIYADSMLAIARAVQYAILVAVVLHLGHDMDRGAVTPSALWAALRRGVWAIALVSIAVTLAVPSLSPPAVVYPGIPRYRWFLTHPIPTGMLLGLALLMVAGSLLAVRDRQLEGRLWWQVGRWGLLPIFLGFLLATRTRGPLFATAFALLLLVLLSPDRRSRGSGILLGVVALATLIGTTVGDDLVQLVLRGQSQDQFLSLTGRDTLFGYGLQLVGEHPFVGYGYLAARSVFLARFPWAGESHNVLLEVALSMGLVGLVAFGVVVFRTCRGLWLGLTDGGRASVYAREALAVMAFLALMGMIGEGFAGPVGTEPMLLVILALLSDRSREVAAARTEPPGARDRSEGTATTRSRRR